MNRVLRYFKKDPVLMASLCLAILSTFLVKPSASYIEYIDFRVLGILLSLMLVMAGFQKNDFFDYLGRLLLKKCHNILQLVLVLTFLCFFSSMLITNDVALITFVPFAVMTLRKAGKEKLYIPVIVSQTLAANLGSMLTPLGNPQNLYLYNLAEFSIVSFLKLLFPYTLISGLLLLLMQWFIVRKDAKDSQSLLTENDQVTIRKDIFWKNGVYGVLFLCCLLTVFRLVPYYVVLIGILLVLCFLDRYVIGSVDYSLLLTFIFFFVFTGNLGKIEVVQNALSQVIANREVYIGVLASQFISNVPAALLLSGFTNDYSALLLGVDLGGLGTLIASMASLISYKIYAATEGAQKGKYLLVFSVTNIVFLGILLLANLIL